jgi:hypothetical protein
MPINAKINGSWSNGTPFIKTSSSWTTAKQVFAKVNGTWQTVYTSSVSDNFDRANNASLGNVPDTDYTWTQTDGSWSINTNKVETITPASSYPMIDVEFNTQNVARGANINATGTSQASGKYGAGIAFWIVDSTNWWAAYNDVVTTGTIVYTCAPTFNGKPLQSGQGTSTCVYDYAATATTIPGSEYCASGTGPVAAFARYNVSTRTTDVVKYNVCITATPATPEAVEVEPFSTRPVTENAPLVRTAVPFALTLVTAEEVTTTADAAVTVRVGAEAPIFTPATRISAETVLVATRATAVE